MTQQLPPRPKRIARSNRGWDSPLFASSQLHGFDHADQRAWVGVEQFQSFERFVAETGQAANLALWELQGTVTVQVEAEHFLIAAVALLPATEQVRRCMVSVKDTVIRPLCALD